MIFRKDIATSEYNPYYSAYLNTIPENKTIMEALEEGLASSIQLVNELHVDLSYRYAPQKWSIGQVLQHNIDTERVFAYRALRFMRGDTTALTGFDQDVFTHDFKDYAFAKANLINAITATRQATIQLYSEVNDELLARIGIANNNAMSARAIPFIITGHALHHENVIRSKYLT